MKVHSLAELGAVRKALRRAQHEAAEQAAAVRARDLAARQALQPALQPALEQQASPHGLFARSVGWVHPLRDRQLADLALPRPAPQPRQRELDEQAALAESMSDEVNLESLLLTDDGLSFRRPGIGPDVVVKLRRGHWALQGQLDLHGYNREEARTLLAGYIRHSHQLGKRCLRVVHGKGLGSPGKAPVLKGRVQSWLIQKSEVLAFVQARGDEGGAGAVVVLLKPGLAGPVR